MKMNLLEYFIINSSIRKWVQNTIEIRGFTDIATHSLKNKNVLEIGCGNGNGTKLINIYYKPAHIEGIDVDERMIEKAKKNNLSNVNFIVGDVAKLPYESSSFDAVFDFAILHHIPNWKDAIDEVSRVLKPRGFFFMEDASWETFQTPVGKLMKMVTDHPYESMYKMNELFEYIVKKGFLVIKKKIYKPLQLTSRFVLIVKKT